MTHDYDVVVIGTGFGATMTALPIADQFKRRAKGEKVLMLERGTWWTTPVSTVQDKEVGTLDFLRAQQQPVQPWSAVGTTRGLIDIVTRCYRTTRNADGLFDFMTMGRKRFLGLFGGHADGVSVIRASGVGGGSLVYSNITVRPPNFIFDDARWPITWSGDERNEYYDTARDAIGVGLFYALEQRKTRENNPKLFGGRVESFTPLQKIVLLIPQRDLLPDVSKEFVVTNATQLPPKPPAPGDNVWVRIDAQGNAASIVAQARLNTGLSNISTRSARLEPEWDIQPDPDNRWRGVKRIKSNATDDPRHELWIDRARVFQTEIGKLTSDYGTVDSSINDLPPGAKPYHPNGAPKNYCERQGRCNVGCLPGARHTLNKQLMAAALGRPAPPPTPADPNPKPVPATHKEQLEIRALCEVEVVHALEGGGYRIDYLQRNAESPKNGERKSVTARRVIIAAGCLGTNELLLRSSGQHRATLPNLSPRVGEGFSTNGDYIGFLSKTKMWVSLVRGPVTTSFAHFNTGTAETGQNTALFHNIEDQGIPPALAALVGNGVPFIRSLGKGRRNFFRIALQILLLAWRTFIGIFKNAEEQQDFFKSEDERTGRMMCVVAQGREAACGKFTLGGAGDTPLRVRRMDHKEFWQDEIFQAIDATVQKLGEQMRADPNDQFFNPFLQKSVDALAPTSVPVAHPLGGCRMGSDAEHGVVDEFGRVFDTSHAGAVYDGLYVADAAIIPTSLGVNPSLTISALALRVADKIIQEIETGG